MVNETGNKDKANYKVRILFLAVILTAIISVVRFPRGDVNYYNSDATWHTLLTIEAYNETPASEHLFLPIVTLGEQEDKFIPWGATVPDEKGNYFYTSFSSAGYFLPWLFMKIFNLKICEKSLYIFNSLLFSLSAAVWVLFLLRIFARSDKKYILALIGLFTYASSPELLHGMGIVYWHQSILQVTLPIQIMAFLAMNENNSKRAKIVFWLLVLFNPFTEWTGYVANMGFIAAEIIMGGRENIKSSLIKASAIFNITLLAFLLFSLQYILRIDSVSYFKAIKDRFLGRGLESGEKYSTLFGRYAASFLFNWVLFIILIIWNGIRSKKIECRYGLVLFLLAFPLVENIIMKQHAVEYSYDRMKGIFLLSFVICVLAEQLMKYSQGKRTAAAVLGLTVAISIINLGSYLSSDVYRWKVDYYDGNKALADYINENYSDSCVSIRGLRVRGYVNLLFGRGVYEYGDEAGMKRVTRERDKRYAIIVDADGAPGNVYDMKGAVIYDMKTGKTINLTEENGVIKAE